MDFAEFDVAVDSAIARARRAATEARETSAKFRHETRQLAEGMKDGTTQAHPDEHTDDRLRRTATGFRTDHGLPVHDLPATPPPATQGPHRTTGSSRRIAPPSDDDEDFSQERIMW
jgi:hypothetical protein